MMSTRRILLLSVILTFLTGTFLHAQSYIETSRLSFNTSSREMAPAFYKNGLVFCSDRKRDVVPSNVDLNNNQFTNLYRSEQKKPGKYDNPGLLSRELTTFLHEGPACFSRNGNTIYFTRNIDVSSGKRNRQRQDTAFGIYSATMMNGQWSSITPFKFNSPAYNTGYPYISDDGNMLFFCSNREDGYGGYDIYVSSRENGNWTQPKNLGENVNTPANDVFPFLHGSGRLYFASRGHKQRSDLDIYYTVNLDGVWQKPLPLGEPYNSPGNDYSLILNSSQDTAYFASDRSGSADIFMAHSAMPVFGACKQQEENDYCYVFYEPNNNELDTTAFAYEWDMGDGTKIRKLKAEHCFSGPGTYLVQLNVVDKITKEVALNQASDNFLVEDIEQPFITAPDTVISGKEMGISGHKTFFKSLKISGYYWDFGDGYRSSGMEARHTFQYPGVYDLQLGITGEPGESGENPAKVCSTRRIIVLPREE